CSRRMSSRAPCGGGRSAAQSSCARAPAPRTSATRCWPATSKAAWSPEAHHPVDVAPARGLEPSAGKLGQLRCRGLVGHRLLQPEIVKGAVAVPVVDTSRDLSTTDVEQARSQLFYLHAATFAAPALAREYEDTLAIELAILIGFDAVVLPEVQKRFDPWSGLRQPGVAARLWPAHGRELDLGIRPLGPLFGH